MMRTQHGRSGWNSAALLSFAFLCICMLVYFFRDQFRLDDSIGRITDGFRSFGYLKNGHDAAAPKPSKPGTNWKHPIDQDGAWNGTQVDMVVASMKSDNTTWITDRLRDWRPMIYIVDDETAELTVPHNKGKESMVYLTYIIENYYNLPEFVIFAHAGRFQWHNDDPDYDGLAVLRRLQLPYVRSQGYVNLRCTWVLGCPVEIRPFDDENSKDEYKKTASVYKRAFQELMPGVEVPPAVGQSCCAQFAATRDTIRSRKRSDYEHMRDWLINTDLDDRTSGRVFEYLWHIVFGKEAVFCPTANECYCKLFGLCGLECDEGSCTNRYRLPQYTEMPAGWPNLDADGMERAYKEPAWRRRSYEDLSTRYPAAG